jgi:hypothetical protein
MAPARHISEKTKDTTFSGSSNSKQKNREIAAHPARLDHLRRDFNLFCGRARPRQANLVTLHFS